MGSKRIDHLRVLRDGLDEPRDFNRSRTMEFRRAFKNLMPSQTASDGEFPADDAEGNISDYRSRATALLDEALGHSSLFTIRPDGRAVPLGEELVDEIYPRLVQ